MRVAVATLLLVLAFGAPAAAGGWAVTTLDQLPPDIHAGQTYAIGYTIRQHGVTPVDVTKMGGTSEIQATAPDGAKTLRYPGVPEGPTGHYVAQVTFPSDGTWTWTVTQGPFAPQPLGPVTVGALALATGAPAPVAAPVSAPASTPQPTGPNAPLVIALLLASSGAAILFGSRVAVFAHRRGTA